MPEQSNGSSGSDNGGVIKLLTREEIIEKVDLNFEIVEVPEWGGNVRVKALTGKERDAFEASLVIIKKSVGPKGKIEKRDMSTLNIRAKLCALTIVDARGERMFGDDMIEALGAKSAAALDRVFDVASRLSKINVDDVEEAAGNSESGRGAALS